MSSVILGPDQAEGLRRMMGNLPSSNTKIIAVTSGKGGVGKSNFALNLGIALSKLRDEQGNLLNKKVIIMDADLGLANINVLLGIIPKHNLFHVLKGAKKMKDIIVQTDVGVDIIAGASGFAQLANMNDDEKMNFINALKEISDADYIIIDTSAGISSNVLSFVMAAHETIIITTPEPTSITDAYGVIKSIAAEFEVPIEKGKEIKELPNLKLVINRVKNTIEADKVGKRIIDIAGHFLNVKVDNLGFIFEDEIVSLAVKKQIPFMVLSPKSKASLCVDHVARRLMNIEIPEEKIGWKKFFGSIFGR